MSWPESAAACRTSCCHVDSEAAADEGAAGSGRGAIAVEEVRVAEQQSRCLGAWGVAAAACGDAAAVQGLQLRRWLHDGAVAK